MTRALTLLVLFACEAPDKEGIDTQVPACSSDCDSDGYASDDCDDDDPDIHPGAIDVCGDGLDQDCAGGDAACACPDDDGDGYAAADGADCAGDCDDTDNTINPDAVESCDGEDNDCDGVVDEMWSSSEADTGGEDTAGPDTAAGADVPDETLHYEAYGRDADGDGFGDPDEIVYACAPPEGYVADMTDCDDDDSTDSPAASEICDDDDDDDDCDGLSDDDDDSVIDYVDLYSDDDGDGHGAADGYVLRTDLCDPPDAGGWSRDHEDCNDADANISRDAIELCDEANVDEDCNGLSDNQDSGATGLTTWYTDADADSYTLSSATDACDAPVGYAAASAQEDCDDAESSVNPSAQETCDRVDNDCDGAIDDDDPDIQDSPDADIWYADSDSDGFGTPDDTQVTCAAPAMYVADATDCDDSDDEVNPDALEACNSTDDDCDGLVDDDDPDIQDNTDVDIWYADVDHDGYGWSGTDIRACLQPAETSSNDTDCDDNNGSYYDWVTYYDDVDNDGYGDASDTKAFCGPPSGRYVANFTDCDDDDPKVSPIAVELCNGYDDDCDGLTDDDDGDIDPDSLTRWYVDEDSDGYGSKIVTFSARCEAATGEVANGDDCDDDNGDVNPAASETCNDVDDDCDYDIDEGLATSLWGIDSDGDGYGSAESAIEDCGAPSGSYIASVDDCDDAKADIHPGATESCDGVDSDCDDEAENCTAVSSTDIALEPSAGVVTYEVSYPELAEDTIAFIAVGKLIEHGDDQCDFETTITDLGGSYKFEIDLEHCGYGHYSSLYGFEATAMVFSSVGESGGFESFDLSVHGGGSDSSSSSVAIDDASDIIPLCAVYSADGEGDIDTEWSCNLSYADDELEGTLYNNDGNGSSWVGARYMALGIGDNLTIDSQDFKCSTGSSTTVTHEISDALGDDHQAVVVLRGWDADTKDHMSVESSCEQSGTEYSCEVLCYGSGDTVYGTILFLDGDYQ